MSKILKFEQIADSRFVSDTSLEIKRIHDGIINALNTLKGVSVKTTEVRLLDRWADGSNQRRQTYYIEKTGRKSTWDDVMRAVNEVKAPRYQFV